MNNIFASEKKKKLRYIWFLRFNSCFQFLVSFFGYIWIFNWKRIGFE